jgi:hypothetical protein
MSEHRWDCKCNDCYSLWLEELATWVEDDLSPDEDESIIEDNACAFPQK